MRRTLALILIPAMLSACSGNDLQQVTSNSRGPDEFLVEPKAELQMPQSYAQLPPPTPGQGNRVDIDPAAEMATALGGRPSNPNGPVPGADAALVTAASRLGVPPNIRQTLAQEDAQFRAAQSRFTGFQLFPENVYAKAYRSQTLNARATAEAWRRAGAGTPSYPPPQ